MKQGTGDTNRCMVDTSVSYDDANKIMEQRKLSQGVGGVRSLLYIVHTSVLQACISQCQPETSHVSAGQALVPRAPIVAYIRRVCTSFHSSILTRVYPPSSV